MRITNNMLIGNLSYNLNQSLNRMDLLQYQSYTGKKFRLPSDDPIGASKSLRLRTDISKIQQYRRNVSDAGSWMRETESALKEVNNILHRANDLIVQAASETNAPDDLEKIQAEISELKDSLVKLGNSTYGGRYIFSGYKTDMKLLDEEGNYAISLEEAFARDEEGYVLNNQGERLEVNGQEIKTDEKVRELLENGSISRDDLKIYDGVFEYNTGIAETIRVNSLGHTIFGIHQGGAILGNEDYQEDYETRPQGGEKAYIVALFEELEEALKNPEDIGKLQDGIERLEKARSNTLSVTATIGARSNRLEVTGQKLEDQNLNLEELLSDVENVSLSEVYMKLMLEKNVYTASLSIGSQIIQGSLVDFIR